MVGSRWKAVNKALSRWEIVKMFFSPRLKTVKLMFKMANNEDGLLKMGNSSEGALTMNLAIRLFQNVIASYKSISLITLMGPVVP